MDTVPIMRVATSELDESAHSCPQCRQHIGDETAVCPRCGTVAYPRPELETSAPKWAVVLSRITTVLFAVASTAVVTYIFGGMNLPGYMDHIQLAEVGAFVLMSLTALGIYAGKNLNANARALGDSKRNEKQTT